MRKLFTEPLFLFFVFQIPLVGYLFLTRRAIRIAWLLAGSLAYLWIVSLPVTANFLEHLLYLTESTPMDAHRDAIVVLAGGYHRESEPEWDFLADDTTSRVLHGVDWWRHNPHAKLIFTGASTEDPKRPLRREVDLMSQLAERFGVPPSAIIEEPTATDTAEHPVALLRLPGITSTTRLGVVTSSWHLRRAMAEFRLHFADALPYPYAPSPLETEFWESWLPRRSALSHSTTVLHEWMGLAFASIRCWLQPTQKA